MNCWFECTDQGGEDNVIGFIKNNIEPDKKIRTAEIFVLIALLISSAVSFFAGFSKLNACSGNIQYADSIVMTRDTEEEDYDEDSTVCDVIYVNGDKSMIISYSYEEYAELDEDTITAYEYVTDDDVSLCFDHQDPSQQEVIKAYQNIMTDEMAPVFNYAISAVILVISLSIVLLFSQFFTTYEKCWFMAIMILATIFSVLFPEESANGVNGIVIMLLYLLDTFLNILCELLISKQSRYNFLVSVLVEITEIVICIVLMYRFATMVTTLFFWLPIDIVSYINWTKHKDDEEDDLTKVRALKGWQEVLAILFIIVWTAGVGYLISGLDIRTDFFGNNEALETAIIYIDACASVVGVLNGIFIFFRFREQWIAWYICALLEAVINIMSGQYVLLILKLGYFTNTTYGYIKWSRYIKSHKEEKLTLL